MVQFLVNIYKPLFLKSAGFLTIFERELALLVALQGESSWKGGSAWGDSHRKDATRRRTEGRKTAETCIRSALDLHQT